MASKPPFRVNVALSAEEMRLCWRALGVLMSDYNDEPHDEIATLRLRLAELHDDLTGETP